jgi:hypothetical protein
MFGRRLMAGLVAAAMVVSAGISAAIDPNTARRAQGKPAAAQPTVRAQPPAQVQVQRARPAPQQAQPQQQARRSGGGGGGGNTGRNVAIGVGAAVIGGVILSEAARAERRRQGVVVIEDDGVYEDADDRRQRCDDNFRGFDWDTGTYRNRYGDRVRCPYLRNRD